MCFRVVGDVCGDDDDFFFSFFSFFGKDDGEDERVRFSRCCAFVLARKIDDNVDFGRGKVGRRIGDSECDDATLSAACSPVDKLSFDPGNWENVGAKLISKTMSSDFAFENGIEMNAVKGKCGEYEVSAADLTAARSLASFCTRKRAGTESRLKILDANLPWMGALIVQHTLHRKNRPSVDRFRWLRARRRLRTVIYHFTIESTTDLR